MSDKSFGPDFGGVRRKWNSMDMFKEAISDNHKIYVLRGVVTSSSRMLMATKSRSARAGKTFVGSLCRRKFTQVLVQATPFFRME